MDLVEISDQGHAHTSGRAKLRPPTVYLFVPATRPELIAKAFSRKPDAVIVDLEDSVDELQKDFARELLQSVVIDDAAGALLRINATSSSHLERDIRAVSSLAWVRSVVLPKVESAAEVDAVARELPPDVGVTALVETAAGITMVNEIARSRAERLMFGSVDYLADIQASSSREALAYPRCRLVVASRAAGLPAPVDGPTLEMLDYDKVLQDAQDGRALGLGAKVCIHPAQIPAVREAFRSPDDQLRWAEGVLGSATMHAPGVFAYENMMIDNPVLVRARQIVDQAARDG